MMEKVKKQMNKKGFELFWGYGFILLEVLFFVFLALILIEESKIISGEKFPDLKRFCESNGGVAGGGCGEGIVCETKEDGFDIRYKVYKKNGRILMLELHRE